MHSSGEFSSPKIVSQEKLAEQISRLQADSRTIVSTNGCFDILHPGHIKFLENAKTLGDILIVALNSDSSVKAIKGDKRPIISQELRAYALASLIYTDLIVIFHEDTPEKVLELIKPDIHVKGKEYEHSGIPEQRVVESHGGNVIYLPLTKGLSTTGLMKKIRTSG